MNLLDARALYAVGLDRRSVFALMDAVQTASNVENGAMPGQTASEIKTAYESNSDTNAFTDAEKSKLDGVESNASADQTAEEIKTAYESNDDTNAFTNAEQAKLAAVEAGATADQSAAEIKTAYESNADTNAFTDAEQTKLSGIETSATADQTDAEILAAWESESSLDADNLVLINGSRAFTGAVQLLSTTVSGAPAAGTAGRVIYVSDGDAGSPCLAVDNGTNWLRVSLGAAISAT